MNPLRSALDSARHANRSTFVPFLTAGDPNLAATLEYVDALVDGGADVLELGIPFSDPLADGPVIQRATERALAAGTTARDVLATVEKLRARHDIPVVLMTYLNPVLRYGWDAFRRDAAAAGASGLILTDVPPEEADPFLPGARESSLGTVFLAAPTSDPARVRRAAEISTGFVYCVSRLGVTGTRDDLSDAFRPVLESIRAAADVPVGLGFGISTPEHAARAAALADAVIVGSRLVRVAEEAGGDAARRLQAEARAFKQAITEARA
ncbi:MAG: tryptophan synthase subunit alpha [Gemmatimonadetes bacterium]|nr:tryptophan synthase subunit alpha [Gemmatimonadota bacterium]